MKKLYTLFTLVLLAFAFNYANAQTVTQVFTTSGTFNVPAGVNSITIEVVGAGGDGGGNGGGGGYALGTFSVVPLSSLPVTVGIHSTSGVGATSSVSTLISATGGFGGASGAGSFGGGGGTGTGGTINNTGGNGGNGTYTYFGGGGGGAAGITSNGNVGGNTIPWTGICITPGGTPGLSGGTPGGDGGKGSGFTEATCTTDNPATPGLNYGGGGGGGNGNSGPASLGADGVVIISYCSIDVSTSTVGTTITSNAVSPTAYQWINCATMLPIPGETNDSYTATANGDYAVEITDGDCTDTSACVTISSVGINSIDGIEKISVHPNPFTNKISVGNVKGDEKFELINSIGKIVWNGTMIGNADLSNLPADVYVLKITTMKGIETITVIKE